MLRVVRLVPVLDFGGVESAIVVQAQHTDRTRVDLRVCTFWKPGRAASAIRAHGIRVDVLNVRPAIRNPAASLKLARYLRDVRPDVLHASVPEADFHAGLVGRLSGARCTVLDEAGMPRRTGVKRLIFASLYRNVDGIIAVSEALRDYLVREERAPARRVRVVYNCGDPAFFESPKVTYHVTPPFRLVAVGRLVDIKNHVVLLDAVRALRDRHVQLKLTLVGDGPLRTSLQRRVADLAIGDSVSVSGFVPDLVSELRAADAYALPSLSEGCSLSLIEAMAMALPIVASRVPGNREVMREMADEWCVPPRDVQGWVSTLERLVRATPEERATLGGQARRIARDHFSARAYVTALQEAYDHFYAASRRA